VKVTVEQAKLELDQLLDRVEAGEEVIILRDGRPIALIVPVAASAGASDASPTANPSAENPPVRRVGWAKDIITYIAPDFDEPLEDFREYME
jgi:prevent-host-death family protein